MLAEQFRAMETELTFNMLLDDDTDVAMEGFGDILRSGANKISKWWHNFVTFLRTLVNKLRIWFQKKRGKIMVHKQGIIILFDSINKATAMISRPIKLEDLDINKFVDVVRLSDTENYLISRKVDNASAYRPLRNGEDDKIINLIADIENCELHPGEQFQDQDVYNFFHIISKAVELLTSFFNAIKWDLSTVVDKDKEVKLDEEIEIDMDDIVPAARF